MALRNTRLEYGLAEEWLHRMVVVHVLAALYHHFVLMNDALKRMTVGVAEEGRLDG